jgi:hypothetical protein
MMRSWDDLVAVVEQITLSGEPDALIWCYNSTGLYSSSSLYSIINFRGVSPVYIPAVWDTVVPPKINLFLWLLSQNESIQHLFFECVVARAIWGFVSEFLGFDIGASYISVNSKWLLKDKCYVVNVISTAVLRGLWLIRNDTVFNKQGWTEVKTVLRRIYKLSMEWKITSRK